MRLFSRALIVVVLIAGVVGSLQALPQGGFYEEFYTDPDFTNMVGWADSECNGGYTFEGTEGPYRYLEKWNCQTGNPSQPCSWWKCNTFTPPGQYNQCTCVLR
jgi:hypothetical protein